MKTRQIFFHIAYNMVTYHTKASQYSMFFSAWYLRGRLKSMAVVEANKYKTYVSRTWGQNNYHMGVIQILWRSTQTRSCQCHRFDGIQWVTDALQNRYANVIFQTSMGYVFLGNSTIVKSEMSSALDAFWWTRNVKLSRHVSSQDQAGPWG